MPSVQFKSLVYARNLGSFRNPFSRENGAFCQSLYQVLSEAFVGLTAVEGGCRGFLQTGNLTSFKKLKNPQAVMNNCLFLTQGGGQTPLVIQKPRFSKPGFRHL